MEIRLRRQQQLPSKVHAEVTPNYQVRLSKNMTETENTSDSFSNLFDRSVEDHFEDLVSASAMVPLGDPTQPNCRYGLKSCFWGPSGIGKSEIIKQGAEKVGLEVRVLVPGQRQPEDFSGVVVANGQGGITVECILGAVRDLNEIGKGIIFIDEASTAPPAVQGAMLTMINDGVVGDTVIEPGIRILLAANPPEMSAGGWGFEAPFANRIAHFSVKCPSAEAWVEWLMSEGIDEDPVPITRTETQLVENWVKVWPQVKGILAGFAMANRQVLHKQPPSEDPRSGFAWPSPRTWNLTGRAIATIRSLNMNKELEEIMAAGIVGQGPAIEFMNYIAQADLPKPEDVLENGWKIDENRLDRVYAVYASIVSYTKEIRDKEKKYQMAELVWKRLSELINANFADLAMRGANQMIKLGLARKGTPDSLKQACEPVIFEIGNRGLAKYA